MGCRHVHTWLACISRRNSFVERLLCEFVYTCASIAEVDRMQLRYRLNPAINIEVSPVIFLQT